MGIIQKDALRTSIISYIGVLLGYLNKGFLFVVLLTTEEIGLVNLLLAVSLMFSQFANLGALNSIWRFFPILKNKERNHYGFLTFNLLIILLGIVVVSLLLILFRGAIVDVYSARSEAFIEYFYLVIPCGTGILVYRLLDGYLRALFKSVFAIFVNDILLRLLVSGLLALYAYDVISFELFVILTCLGQWLPALLLVAYLVYLNEWVLSIKEISISRKTRKIILKYSGLSYVNSIGSSIVVTIDALMVASMLGLSETGVYTTVTFITRVLTIPYLSIMRVSIPIVPGLWKERNMISMNALYKKVSSVSLVLGLYLFLGVWVNRVDLFQLLPKEFEEGVFVFLFIMIGKLIDMFFGLNGTILVTSKKYMYDMIFTGLLMVLVFVLNLWMIPVYGMMGAAISTAIAYLLYNLCRLIFVWVNYDLLPFTINQVKGLVLFSLCLLFMEFIPLEVENIWLNMAIKSILVTLLFPGIIYLLKMEPEIVSYIDKVLVVIREKIRNKKG